MLVAATRRRSARFRGTMTVIPASVIAEAVVDISVLAGEADVCGSRAGRRDLVPDYRARGVRDLLRRADLVVMDVDNVAA